MRVLMFGWEFPPHIAGGLGTACYGLTKGMSHLSDLDVVFVVPKAYGDEDQSVIRLVGANNVKVTERKLNLSHFKKKLDYIEVDSKLVPYVDPEELVNVDVIYEDVAQPDQIDILVRNSERFLKRNGYVMLAVKSQSIDVSKPVKVVFEDVINEFSKNFQLVEQTDIHRFEKDHIFLVGQKL